MLQAAFYNLLCSFMLWERSKLLVLIKVELLNNKLTIHHAHNCIPIYSYLLYIILNEYALLTCVWMSGNEDFGTPNLLNVRLSICVLYMFNSTF